MTITFFSRGQKQNNIPPPHPPQKPTMPARSRSPSKHVKRSKPKRSKQQKARPASQKQKRNGRISKRNRSSGNRQRKQRLAYREVDDTSVSVAEIMKQKRQEQE